MRPRSLDLLLAGFWVVSITVTLPFEDAVPGFVRSLTGAIIIGMLLYATYALVSALYHERLDPALRIALSLGLFIGFTLMIGLGLNLTPAGITRAGWIMGYSVLGLLLLVATYSVRLHTSPEPPPRLKASSAALLMLLVIIFATSYAVARIGLDRQPRAGFTLLWLQRDDSASGIQLDLGITSDEDAPERYRLEVRAGDTLLQSWTDIDLAPGETWKTSLEVPPNTVAPVTGQLYRAGDTEPYRRVEFWLNR